MILDSTQLPRVKADRKIEELYRSDAPWPRLGEALPAFGLALLVVWKTRSFALVWPCYAYIGYLVADLVVVPQRKLTKWIRNGSVAAFTVGYVIHVLPSLGLPAPIARTALLALLAGAGLPYLYERGRIANGFVQGLTLATLLALGAQYLFRRRSGCTSRCRSSARPTPGTSAASSGGTRRRSWGLCAPRPALARRAERALAARDRRPRRVGPQSCAAGRGRGVELRSGRAPAPPRPRSVCATDARARRPGAPAFGHTERPRRVIGDAAPDSILRVCRPHRMVE